MTRRIFDGTESPEATAPPFQMTDSGSVDTSIPFECTAEYRNIQWAKMQGSRLLGFDDLRKYTYPDDLPDTLKSGDVVQNVPVR